ncbi:MAG: hypothetical protein IT534_10465 [Bauldia sp.]|nr:hypothetical protein [Bauldia sp.]
MRRILLAFAALLGVALPALAQTTGLAAALGGDRLDLNGRRFQLAGVDALEPDQSCFVDGRPFACGASAIRALQTLLDGIAVTCAPTGAMAGDFELATCTTAEGDVAENLMAAGWALADRGQSDAYVAAEDAARAAGIGAWAGAFVAPATWREDMAAIEARYVARSLDALRVDVERALTADRGGIGIFTAIPVTFGEADVVQREVRARALAAGFIDDAIGEREVFTWPAVASALHRWREIAVGGAVANAVAMAWAELEARPGAVLEVLDAAAFYEAMTTAAAPIVAAGRNPILLIAATDNPKWFRDWFGGAAPEGAEVGARDDAGAGYMGTIDGIDVYVAAVPSDTALLVAGDTLRGIVYRRNADGTIVTLTRDDAPDPDELVFGFARGLAWSDEPPVRIHYPYEVAVPDNGS